MGKRSRNKGAAWERDVAFRFRESGIDAERCLTETRDGNVGDLTFPNGEPVVVQAKCGARPPIYDAIREAVEAADGTGKYPVAIIKRNGAGQRPADEFACIPLDSFFDIVKALREHVW